MKKIIKLAFTVFILRASFFVNAQDLMCRSENRSSLSILEKSISSCKLQAEFALTEEVAEKHKKVIYEKLADKLGLQINQNSEELALLTSFFAFNGEDLLMNSKDVKENCNLKKIETIETCGKKRLELKEKEKLSMLMGKLTKNSNAKSKLGKGVSGVLAEKFAQNLGILSKENESAQCPIQKSSGGFILQSQFDEVTSDEIVNDFLKNNDTINVKFDKYAQLKLIKDTGDKDFINKFISYIKNKPNNISSKVYFINFFKDKKNQSILAPTLAKQCKNITDNIETFLCKDIEELGSIKSAVSTKMFGGLDIGNLNDQVMVNYDEDKNILTAYGFQCLALENNKNHKNIVKIDKQSVDGWYEKFTQDTRQKDGEELSLVAAKKFCDKYLCKNEKVKNHFSCKNGGPITSLGLKEIYGCEKKEEMCNADILKSIEYLSSLEKLKTLSNPLATNNNNNSSSSLPSGTYGPTSPAKTLGSLPSFAENYLGVKETLVALGSPVTPEAVAEKTRDFAQKNLNTSTSAQNAIANNVNNREENKFQTQTQPQQGQNNSYASSDSPNESYYPSNNSDHVEKSEPTKPKEVKKTKKSKAYASNSSSSEYESEDENDGDEIKKSSPTQSKIKASSDVGQGDTSVASGISKRPEVNGINDNTYEKMRRDIENQQYRIDQEDRRLGEYRRALDERESRIRNIERAPDINNRTVASDGAPAASGEENSAGNKTKSKGDNRESGGIRLSANGQNTDNYFDKKKYDGESIAVFSEDEFKNLDIKDVREYWNNKDKDFLIQIKNGKEIANVFITLDQNQNIVIRDIDKLNPKVKKMVMDSNIFRRTVISRIKYKDLKKLSPGII